jgi:hypothetical protein
MFLTFRFPKGRSNTMQPSRSDQALFKGQEPESAGAAEDCLIRVVRYMNPSFSKVSCIGVFSAIPHPPDFRFILDTTVR